MDNGSLDANALNAELLKEEEVHKIVRKLIKK